jgi:hypothetical protein
MPFIIREHPTHLTPINGVAFAVHEAGSISAEVGDELAELFLSVPLFRLAEDDELPEGVKPTPAPVVTPPVVKETAAQKKAREKAEREKAAQEQAEQDAAAQAAIDAANKPAEGDTTTEQTGGEDGEQTGGEQIDGEKPEGDAATTQNNPETGANGDGATAGDPPADDVF